MNSKISRQYGHLSRVIKALAHPTRLFIVDQLSQKKLCVCELKDMIGADMSTVSKHLTLLKDCGVVDCEKVGTSCIYSLCCPCILEFIGCIEKVIVDQTNEFLDMRKKRCSAPVSKKR
jgi:DNA-binding transcriptional ArsR family regulator